MRNIIFYCICIAPLMFAVHSGAAVCAASEIAVEVDGEKLDVAGVQPEVKGDRVFVPLRLIGERLGYAVNWDPSTKTASVEGKFTHTLGESYATLNTGEKLGVCAPSYIKGGRLMVSIRLIAESLGCKTDWDGKEGKVVIRKDGGGVAIQEFGENSAVLDYGGDVQAFIAFPVTGIAGVDGPIQKWANEYYYSVKGDVGELRKTAPQAQAEVNFQYNSYIVNGHYAGIEENGYYWNSSMASPKAPVKIFNIDLRTGAFITNAEIIDPAKMETALSALKRKLLKLYPGLGGIDGMDETWLSNIVLTHNGVAVLLEKDTHLPSYMGSVRVEVSEKELGPAYLLETGQLADAGPIAPETPRPTAKLGKPDASKPMIALTFDDGPSAHTARVLKLLSEHGGRATFFEVGNRMSKYPEAMKAIVAQGSEIAGHSWDHRQLTKLNAKDIMEELNSTKAEIKKYTGTSVAFYRPPYGACNDSLKKLSKDLGLAMVNWSIDTLDWKSRNPSTIYDATMKNMKNRSIVLYHDLFKTTADAMEAIIPKLAADGYQMVTVSELLGETSPGQVYNGGE